MSENDNRNCVKGETCKFNGFDTAGNPDIVNVLDPVNVPCDSDTVNIANADISGIGCEICGENQNCDNYMGIEGFSNRLEKPSVLLHSCCGPCSTAVVERLAPDYQITIFFYNPCITDEEEYQKRKKTQLEFIDQYNSSLPPKEHIRFMEGPYDTKNYYKIVEGLEEEPEGGGRCKQCFRQRLEKTAETCSMAGCDYFTTTLTVSPHKNYKVISDIGKEIALKYSLSFLDMDFKKKDGFKRSTELSKQHGLYRQNYCGCEFSKWWEE